MTVSNEGAFDHEVFPYGTVEMVKLQRFSRKLGTAAQTCVMAMVPIGPQMLCGASGM